MGAAKAAMEEEAAVVVLLSEAEKEAMTEARPNWRQARGGTARTEARAMVERAVGLKRLDSGLWTCRQAASAASAADWLWVIKAAGTGALEERVDGRVREVATEVMAVDVEAMARVGTAEVEAGAREAAAVVMLGSTTGSGWRVVLVGREGSGG